jgi:hypothetical protein
VVVLDADAAEQRRAEQSIWRREGHDDGKRPLHFDGALDEDMDGYVAVYVGRRVTGGSRD